MASHLPHIEGSTCSPCTCVPAHPPHMCFSFFFTISNFWNDSSVLFTAPGCSVQSPHLHPLCSFHLYSLIPLFLLCLKLLLSLTFFLIFFITSTPPLSPLSAYPSPSLHPLPYRSIHPLTFSLFSYSIFCSSSLLIPSQLYCFLFLFLLYFSFTSLCPFVSFILVSTVQRFYLPSHLLLFYFTPPSALNPLLHPFQTSIFSSI